MIFQKVVESSGSHCWAIRNSSNPHSFVVVLDVSYVPTMCYAQWTEMNKRSSIPGMFSHSARETDKPQHDSLDRFCDWSWCNILWGADEGLSHCLEQLALPQQEAPGKQWEGGHSGEQNKAFKGTRRRKQMLCCEQCLLLRSSLGEGAFFTLVESTKFVSWRQKRKERVGVCARIPTASQCQKHRLFWH